MTKASNGKQSHIKVTTPNYRGRFAPSPTGRLHAGSLVAAVGSYLRARHCNGTWLVRMEDLDPPREEQGAASHILKTLEQHHLYWDEEVVYQSQRHHYYQDIIDTWFEEGLVFRCRCSRKMLMRTAKAGEYGVIYPGTCRTLKHDNSQQFSVRLRTHDDVIAFDDQLLGRYEQQLESALGDFIVQRSDGLYSYQLAVVVDDYLQNMTEVVRGEDLLWNTPRQIYIQQLLNYPAPNYMHLPLVVGDDGCKLSKQSFAPVLDPKTPRHNLYQALQFLGFSLESMQPNDMTESEWLDWALLALAKPESTKIVLSSQG